MSTLPPETIALSRAAGLLDVPATSSAADARSAFLRRLEYMNFQPSEDLTAALTALKPDYQSSSRLGTNASCRWKRELLSGQVRTFAENFWKLSPVERLAYWRDLVERCHDEPRLMKKLQKLSLGLTIDVNEFDRHAGNPGQLARFIRDLFTLDPSEQAARRREWLNTTGGDATSWHEAGKLLHYSSAAIVQLDPPLMQAIAERAKPKPPKRKRGDFERAPERLVEIDGRTFTVSNEIPPKYFVGAVAIFLAVVWIFGSSSRPISNTASVPSDTSLTFPKFDLPKHWIKLPVNPKKHLIKLDGVGSGKTDEQAEHLSMPKEIVEPSGDRQ